MGTKQTVKRTLLAVCEIRGQGHFLLPQLGLRDQEIHFTAFYMLANDSKCITWIGFDTNKLFKVGKFINMESMNNKDSSNRPYEKDIKFI